MTGGVSRITHYVSQEQALEPIANSMFSNVLVTGANRGLGLGFTRHYLAGGATVFAGCRKPDQAEELQKVRESAPDRCHVLQLDVTDQSELAEAAREVEAKTDRLDLLLNNAGVFPKNRFETVTEADLVEAFRINSIAPLLVSRQFLPLLRKGSKPLIVVISSLLGSVQLGATTGRWREYAYSSSKAAVNRIIRQMQLDLAPHNVTIIGQYPGWVRTAMGGEGANLSVEDSVRRMAAGFEKLTLTDSGRIVDLDGTDGDV